MCEDICELECLSEAAILLKLKERFQNNSNYIYASNVLIALNPHDTIKDLYGSQQIMKYLSSEKLPPHIYAVANECLKNLKIYRRPQSIVITGVTGSGKTETAKHAINFLCQQSCVENILNANPILEMFGNARTLGNENSSRFCKLTELFYDNEFGQTEAKISYHLLETSRVCAINLNESNFHIFYTLVFGAAKDLLTDISLDSFSSYRYMSDKNLVEKSNGYSIFQKKFQLVDENLGAFGFTKEKKRAVYMILSAILNLGNIQFQTDTDDGCFIQIASEESLRNAAILLNVDKLVLQNALTSRSREIANEIIKSPLTKNAAEKARDSLAQGLYDKLFSQITRYINDVICDTSSLDHSIGIIDIAGFECLTSSNNTFDQLCINYSNERVQNFFVDRMLKTEKEQYTNQGLNIPFVPFLDNSVIIDLFHDKCKGVFALLNDECTVLEPSVDNFTMNLKNSWKNSMDSPISWDIRNEKSEGFLIHHFTNDVYYTTDDFVEKNRKIISKDLQWIISNSTELFVNTEIKSDRKSKTTISVLRHEVDIMMEKLKKTNAHFVRCILPNYEKKSCSFDDELVVMQLKTSSTVAYANFIRFGYPKRIAFQDLVCACKPIEEKLKDTYLWSINFYTKVLLSIGLTLKDFKMGNDMVFFRSNKIHLVQLFLSKAKTENRKISDSPTPKRRKPKSSSEDPFERIEGLLWQSKWRNTLNAIRFLIIWKNNKIKKQENKNDEEKKQQIVDDSRVSISEADSVDRSKKQTGQKRRNSSEEAAVSAKKRTKAKINDPGRYDLLGHFPEIDRSTRARCKNDGCQIKTSVFCIKCNVHLCLIEGRNCFKDFHFRKDDDE